ncbi:MAG: BCCT family transporter, partial [Lachnospiraceae bacterium]|nr:BCCT family transporter [Lachnospiraceae bacterium]
MDKQSEKKSLRRLDPATTIIPFAVILVFCLFFVINPEGSTNALTAIRDFLGDTFGMYYLVIGLGVL